MLTITITFEAPDSLIARYEGTPPQFPHYTPDGPGASLVEGRGPSPAPSLVAEGSRPSWGGYSGRVSRTGGSRLGMEVEWAGSSWGAD